MYLFIEIMLVLLFNASVTEWEGIFSVLRGLCLGITRGSKFPSEEITPQLWNKGSPE